MPNPYEDAIPIPPPPPPKRRGLLWWVLTIALMIMLIPASAGLVYWAYTYHVDAWVQSLITGKTVLVSPVPITSTAPTPTASQAYKQELLSVDFPTFIDGFRQALAANDIQTLMGVEDGIHFTEQCDMADSSCVNNWDTTSAQLTNDELRLFIPANFASITQPPVPSLCENLKPESGHAWVFTSGTYSQTGNLVVPTNGPAVFGFQQPGVGSPWTWDMVILNLDSCDSP